MAPKKIVVNAEDIEPQDQYDGKNINYVDKDPKSSIVIIRRDGDNHGIPFRRGQQVEITPSKTVRNVKDGE